MMLSDKLYKKMNEQVKHELESAYLYYAMVAYFAAENLDGMAQWMTVQTQEEMFHASKFFTYINDRGGKVVLQPLALTKTTWASPLEAFEDALEHEKFITAKINDLMKLAIEENDYAAKVLLDWYVNEQVEEEDSVTRVLNLLQRVGDSGHALILVDRELGQRVFTPPAKGE